MNAIGATYLKQKKWDKAIKYFNECADSLVYPTPHFALSNLGWAYLGKKDYKLAKEYFIKALSISPFYTPALNGFTTVSMETNSEHAAIKKLTKALEKFPDSMIINYDLARMYEKIGHNKKAKEFWEQVAKFAPEQSVFLQEAEKRLY